MTHYRKKPLEIEAMRWNGNNEPEMTEWLDRVSPESKYGFKLDFLFIETLEGIMKADLGDWIICGIKSEIYPCKHEIFEATYEKIEETDTWASANDPCPLQ